MKKLIFILFTVLSFNLYAQEANENTDLTFSANAVSTSSAPQLILHRGGFFDVYSFKLLDGTKLSDGELNKMLKTVPENKSLITKTNIWTGLNYVFLAGFCASLGTTMYAANKGWENMTYYSAAGSFGCFVFAVMSGMVSQSYRSAAVDNYNLQVMGIQIK